MRPYSNAHNNDTYILYFFWVFNYRVPHQIYYSAASNTLRKSPRVKNCAMTKDEGLSICQETSSQRNPPIVFLRFPRFPSLYITSDHRLGSAPRFYRSSNPSRYFCQLYHRLSPGVLVTRKQPGDIIRACLRKSTHSGSRSFHTRGCKASRSEIRYRSRIGSLASDFNFERNP